MDFFDFLPLWGWFILCATVVGLVVVPAGIKKDRVRAVKRDKEDWERRVRKDLKENGYEITAEMR